MLAGRSRVRRLGVIRRWAADYVLDMAARDPECFNLRLLAGGYVIASWRTVARVERFFTRAERRA